MATTPPGTPPPNSPPPGYDPRSQRQYYRDQARAQRAVWRAQRRHWRWQMRGMRRASVLGPLLLIGAGIVFLLIQTGRIDRHDFFASYAHWWPLLLVGAGLIVLAEWALDQFHMSDPDRPQYRRSIGGGVIVLLLFLAFVGGIADMGYGFSHPPDGWFMHDFHNDGDSWAELFGDKHEFDQALDLPLPAGGSVMIGNPRGDVTVTGSSADGRIHITEHKIIYAGSDSDAEDRSKQFAPQTTTEGPETRITIPSIDGARADLTITVPPEAAATVDANRGDVHISEIKAAVTTVANHGSVELAAISGPVSAHINSPGSSLSARSLDQGISIMGHANEITLADITGAVSINGEIFGQTHMEHINGAGHFHTSRTDVQFARLDGDAQISGSGISLEEVQGPLVLSTGNRNVTLDRIAGDIAITNHYGGVELTAAPVSGNQVGNITIENRNGSVKLTLPEHAGFAVQAATTRGDIDTNLTFNPAYGPQPEETIGEKNNKSEKTLRGVVGSSPDAPTVHIKTSDGDINIMKGDVAPLTPPAAPAKITMAPATPKPPHAAKAPKPPATPLTPTPPTP